MLAYANLDTSDVVVAISETYAPIYGGHLVKIDFPDLSVMGKKYDRANSTEGNPIFVDAETQPTIPSSVTLRQAKRVLLAAGLLDQVQATIDSIQDPVQREEAQIDWNYAQTMDRNWSLVQLLSSEMGLTSDELDALFLAASKL